MKSKKLRWAAVGVGAVLIGVLAVLGSRFLTGLNKFALGIDSVPENLLEIDKGFAFPPGFPPDPGKAGRATIEGIDSDRDGVRDDVQRWIYAFVPKDEGKQKALKQRAHAYSEFLSEDFGREKRISALASARKAAACLERHFHDALGGYVEEHYLKAKVLSTSQRTFRFLENDAKITVEEASRTGGKVSNPCEDR